jgi:peptide/nickel transport system permease protein
MVVFVVRRLIVSFFVLLVATFLVYVMVVLSGDPLSYLATDQSPNKAQKIALVIERLNLDDPVPQRYLGWLGGVAGCALPVADCTLGLTKDGQQVSDLLTAALGSTVRLVIAATLLAVVIGVAVGIVSALRQYSGFDYTITFTAFLFFSLPLFWVAVLLKQYVAIRFNDWLADPRIGWPTLLALSLVSALTWRAVLGGDRRRRWIVTGVAFAATAAILYSLSASSWFARPALGPVLLTLFSVGTAYAVAQLTSSVARRNILYVTVATAVVGVVSSFVLAPVLRDPSWGTILLLLLVGLAIGGGIGYAAGGLDRAQAARAGAVTAAFTGFFIFVDQTLRAVPSYSDIVGGRIIATIGSDTPNFEGTFWERFLDICTHLLLPTLALLLISFATYSRYTRATMLETMNQDYVRTARAKGLSERTVVLRHAFRNALIPVTTLMTYDFGFVLGGAVITETVFGWQGMGRLFVRGLQEFEPNPVMAFFIVVAVSIVVFNLIADILYAYLDPRIRVS